MYLFVSSTIRLTRLLSKRREKLSGSWGSGTFGPACSVKGSTITECAWFDHSVIKCNNHIMIVLPVIIGILFILLLIISGAHRLEVWEGESESE